MDKQTGAVVGNGLKNREREREREKERERENKRERERTRETALTPAQSSSLVPLF